MSEDNMALPMPEAADFEGALAAVFLAFRINGISPADVGRDFMAEFTKTFEGDPEKLLEGLHGSLETQSAYFSRDGMNCLQILYLELGKTAKNLQEVSVQTMRMMLLYCLVNFAVGKGTKEPYVLCVCSSFVSLLLTIQTRALQELAEKNHIFLHVDLRKEKDFTSILARVAFAREDAGWLHPGESENPGSGK